VPVAGEHFDAGSVDGDKHGQIDTSRGRRRDYTPPRPLDSCSVRIVRHSHRLAPHIAFQCTVHFALTSTSQRSTSPLFISFMTPNDAHVTMEWADSPITILATMLNSPAEHVLRRSVPLLIQSDRTCTQSH
jgi:hypothetical protein